MHVALASNHEFAAPRIRFEIDVDRIVGLVPASVTSKGMFFNRCLSLARELDEEALLRKVGIEIDRFVPFGDYPWADFIRLATTIADELYSGRTAVGLREIGRTLYGEFADSLVGRMTFGVLRTNADRVIGLGAKAWNVSGVPGEVLSESMGDRHYRYHFCRYPADIAETMAVGVMESALHSCGEVAHLGFAHIDELNAVIDIRW